LIKKLAVVAALAGAAITVSPPAASAASGPIYAGVYPDQAAAEAACHQGKAQGRWIDCVYQTQPASAPMTELWVFV
jgi:hypothetical protein